MTIVVLKFGGTSVATADGWATILDRIRHCLESGETPVVVHSALSGVSNALERILHSATLDQHYEEHVEKGFYPDLKAFMGRSPVMAMVLQGPDDTYAMVRSMMGATNPADSPAGTIRGDFGTEMTENLVHGSDSNESAAREIGIWFPEL